MPEKQKRGFASMSPEKRRAIARMGGKAGKGHKWTRTEARKAGQMGGKIGGKISRRGPVREVAADESNRW